MGRGTDPVPRRVANVIGAAVALLALLVQPGYGADSARALFSQVYEHWRSLPRNARPKLYLHGLSLAR
jgi:uncharacterized membrane protein